MAQSFLKTLLGRRDPQIGLATTVSAAASQQSPLPRRAETATWQLTVVGCGDAFGSGGRLQTSFHLETSRGQFLLDCGATTMVGLNRLGIDPNAVGTILITHLHGDHFGGLVWWLMHANYVSNRSAPLIIAGPAGLRERLHAASEALFPGMAATKYRFPLEFQEFASQVPMDLGGVRVTPYQVNHPSGAQAFAVRVDGQGRSLGFSGDTEWVDNLVPCARGADLMIIDCFGYDADIGFHMSWATISARLPELAARKVMLTHMGTEMLSRAGEVNDPRILLAEDGLVLRMSNEGVARA